MRATLRRHSSAGAAMDCRRGQYRPGVDLRGPGGRGGVVSAEVRAGPAEVGRVLYPRAGEAAFRDN